MATHVEHFAQQGGRLSATSRAKALEAGVWQLSDRTMVKLHELSNLQLIDALLTHLEAGRLDFTDAQYRTIQTTLTTEVVRRKLQDAAMIIAAERMQRKEQ